LNAPQKTKAILFWQKEKAYNKNTGECCKKDDIVI
jgi:hypothetical protein